MPTIIAGQGGKGGSGIRYSVVCIQCAEVRLLEDGHATLCPSYIKGSFRAWSHTSRDSGDKLIDRGEGFVAVYKKC